MLCVDCDAEIEFDITLWFDNEACLRSADGDTTDGRKDHTHLVIDIVINRYQSAYYILTLQTIVGSFSSVSSPAPIKNAKRQVDYSSLSTMITATRTTGMMRNICVIRRSVAKGCELTATISNNRKFTSVSSQTKHMLIRRNCNTTTTYYTSPVSKHYSRGRRYASSNVNNKPTLAYEWIIDGKQSKLNDDEIIKCVHEDGKDVIVFLHGLLGNAKNLRTPAKKLTQVLPNYNALLLDIRGHGNSTSDPSYFEQPHTFSSCVEDIKDTLQPLGLTGMYSPTAICGHSLGGRIALQYSHVLCTTDNTQQIEAPRQTWILDSVPGKADPSVHGVLNAISSLPTPIPSKTWLIDTLVKEHKMNKAIAQWIATNLRDNGDDALDWIFDLHIANELVQNFSNQDFTEMIHDITHPSSNDDDMKRNNSTIQLVMAGKNKSWSEDIIQELESIPSFRYRLHLHTLNKAGHWVHVDDPEGLLKVMVEGLEHQ